MLNGNAPCGDVPCDGLHVRIYVLCPEMRRFSKHSTREKVASRMSIRIPTRLFIPLSNLINAGSKVFQAGLPPLFRLFKGWI